MFSTKNGENGISAMLRSILRFSIWKINYVFGPQAPINCLFLFSFFKTSYGHFCLFSDRYFGNISRTKATIKNAGFQFVDWCMMNIVSENHTQIRKIERGMANLPLWQWLGWPSSQSKSCDHNVTTFVRRRNIFSRYQCTLYCCVSPLTLELVWVVVECWISVLGSADWLQKLSSSNEDIPTLSDLPG